MASTHTGKLFLICGPAGVGKTTLCDLVLEYFPKVQRVITTTSRAPRPNEVEGQDYYFISTEAFEAQICQGAFYEYAEVHGDYKGVYKKEIEAKLSSGVDLLINIDVQGAFHFKDIAREDAVLKERLVSIFIEPASQETLQARLAKRATDSDEQIKTRLKNALEELALADQFHHRITSGTPEEDLAAFKNIYNKS